MTADEIQQGFDQKNPAGVTAPSQPTPATPVSDQDPIQSSFDLKNPKPAVTDDDLGKMNPWEKPPDVPWTDYLYAQTRSLGGALGNAAEDVGKVYADDQTFGLGAPALAATQGADPAAYRSEVDAARERVGASRYGIDAMAYLTNPLRWVGTGLKAEQLAQAGVSKIAPNAAKQIAKRVGDFVEGGTYTGAQSAGHGDDAGTVTRNAVGGGILSSGLGLIAQELAPAAKWIRERVYGTPEGTPAQIAAAQIPGSPADMDANQLKLWKSQNDYGMPPNQPGVRSYASTVYGPDPANWPEALRDIHEAAGQEGTPSTAKRILAQVGTNAMAAGGQYLGLGFSPEVSAILHPAVSAATDAVLPMLGRGFNANPVKGALADAYPALTGWRSSIKTPGWRY